MMGGMISLRLEMVELQGRKVRIPTEAEISRWWWVVFVDEYFRKIKECEHS